MIRASLAGNCYPEERKALMEFVNSWFAKRPVPSSQPVGHLMGVVSPHIDFRVDTSVYAEAFAPYLAAPPADKVLILGVGHRSRLEWSLDGRGYETPLGKVKTDRCALELLAQELPKELWGDPRAHAGEHSIEFALVCVQALRALQGVTAPFEFVPVLCGGLFQYMERNRYPEQGAMLFRLAAVLRQWWLEAEANGQRVHMVISIDGCHMGPRFGHEYWMDEARLTACELWEQHLWSLVERGQLGPFLGFLQEDGNARYFDGVGALALVMAMFGRDAVGLIRRTGYAQWFEKKDGSAVTFSSAQVGISEEKALNV